ncbi:HEAT repeat domain-containing protein [Geobacter sp.]|uniref:HEAT repeat domain-containing protein n=1 Tax=Geobacter sp. TaxID=46610 RepID=UPI0027B8DF2A|nr:HEAT repeat domain-containing protein [Geobacter sp.]
MRGEIGDLRHYLVQVLNPAGEVEGTGFLCHPEGYVLTCWHVIAQWLKVGCETGEVFYQGNCITADLCLDRSIKQADLAVLKLHRLQSGEGSPWPHLPLDVNWRVQLGDELHSFGYPAGQFDGSGIGFKGSMGALTPTPIKGLEAYPITGLNLKNVNGGYSGAPVVDQRLQKVIGLVYAKHRATQAFIVPLRPLFDVWPELRSAHDVFEQIRRRLGEEAQAKLEEKMHHAPFIPLNLDCGVTPERREREAGGEAKAHEHGRKWNEFDPKRLLPLRQSYILSSDVGMGKTVFVHWLAAELVRRTSVVPLLMSCQDLERINPKSGKDLRAVITDRLADEFLEVDCADFFVRAEKEKRFVFLFDGLDQIQGKPSALAQIAFTVAGRSPVLITSRPSAVLAIENDPKLTFLRLKPFSPKDQRRYFGERYSQVKRVCALAADLVEVPMLASMVRELALAGKLKETATRTELYGKFIEHILAEHEPNRPRYLDEPDLSRKIRAQLKEFAFLALADEQPKIQKVPAKLYSEDARVSLNDLTTFGLVNRVLDRGEEALFFTHQSFQEFLAAQYAADKPEEINRILTERWHPKWAEVIRFLAGLLGESIIQRILAEPDNVIHSNLFLAARCAPEIEKPTPTLTQEIKEQLLELAEKEPFCEAASTALVGFGLQLDVCEVLAWVRDEGFKMRRAAVKTLGNLCDRLDAAAVHELVARLGDEDYSVRLAAVEALGELGHRLDEGIVHELVAMLGDKDHFVGRVAIEVLGKLGDRPDAGVVNELLALLGDEKSRVRTAAIEVLGKLGDRLDAGVVHKLVALLGDEDSFVRIAAVEVLGNLGDRLDARAVHELVALLGDEDFQVRIVAVKALGNLGDRLDAEAVHKLVALLGDEKSQVRTAAGKALDNLGDRLDAGAMHELAARLGDENSTVRWTAVEALGKLGDRLDAGVVRKLVALLGDEKSRVRTAAVEALGKLDDRLDAGEVRKLVALVGDEDFHVRIVAVKVLGKLGDRPDAGVVNELLALLGDEKSRVRTAAVEALGKLGDRLDAGVVHKLVALLGDEDSFVRIAAVEVLGNLGDRLDAGVVHKLVARLGDEDSFVRIAAVEVLGNLGDRLDAGAVHELVALLGDEESSVRIAAVKVLGKLADRLDVGGVNELVALLGDEKFRIRAATVKALGNLGDCLDAGAVHELVARLGDEESFVRIAAVEVLGNLGDRLDAGAVHELVARLGDEEPFVRIAAVEALGKLGNWLDGEAVQGITELLAGPDTNTGIYALKTLKRLYLFGVRIQ